MPEALFAESKRLTHAGARALMVAALAEAGKAGIAISCCIVDSGGHVVALERMDGGRFHTVHSATVKAVCAASTRRPTTAQGAAGQALDVLTRSVLRSLQAPSAGPRWRAAIRS